MAFFFVTWLFREYGKVSRENSKIRKIQKMQKNARKLENSKNSKQKTHENSKIRKFEKFKKYARKLENSKIEKIQQQVRAFRWVGPGKKKTGTKSEAFPLHLSWKK